MSAFTGLKEPALHTQCESYLQMYIFAYKICVLTVQTSICADLQHLSCQFCPGSIRQTNAQWWIDFLLNVFITACHCYNCRSIAHFTQKSIELRAHSDTHQHTPGSSKYIAQFMYFSDQITFGQETADNYSIVSDWINSTSTNNLLKT